MSKEQRKMSKNKKIQDLSLHELSYEAQYHSGVPSYTVTSFELIEVKHGEFHKILLIEDSSFIRDSYDGKFSKEKNQDLNYSDRLVFPSEEKAKINAYDNCFQYETRVILDEIEDIEEKLTSLKERKEYDLKKLESLKEQFSKKEEDCVLCGKK